jgi:hypothetical protein
VAFTESDLSELLEAVKAGETSCGRAASIRRCWSGAGGSTGPCSRS